MIKILQQVEDILYEKVDMLDDVRNILHKKNDMSDDVNLYDFLEYVEMLADSDVFKCW